MAPQQPEQASMMEDAANECRNCGGGTWVCENHPDHPWDGTSNREDACGCGAGMPCGACDLEMAAAGYVHAEREAIAAWIREPGWPVANEALAQAIIRGDHRKPPRHTD